MNNLYRKIAIYGAGSWGSALACQLARLNQQVTLFTNNLSIVNEILTKHTNRKYLEGIILPTNIIPTNNLLDLSNQDFIVIAIPSFAFKEVISSLKTKLPLANQTLIIACKGMTKDPVRLFSDVITQELPNIKFAFISGPNFAKEVAKGLYSIATIGSPDIEIANNFAKVIESKNFIVDTTTDIITLQIAGIIKNIIAIHSGINKAKGYGENAQAALVTNALNEIRLLSQAMGGDIKTLTTAGVIGDLALTCYSSNSRNMQFGYELTHANNKKDFIRNYPYLVEGQESITQIMNLINKYNIHLPIVNEVSNILKGDKYVY